MSTDGTSSRVTVVGIGADGWAGLAPAARAALASAQVVLGSARQLALIGDQSAERIRWPSPLRPALPGLFDQLAGLRVCALASGDPMFYGLGNTLCQVLGPDRLEVIPHLSSVSLACARLRWAVPEVTVLSAVGRPLDRLRGVLAPDRRILVLTSDADGGRQVAELVTGQGYRDSEITVLEQLGGPEERLRAGRAGSWHEPPGDPLAVVAVRCVTDPDLEPRSAVTGLPDTAFEHDGQLTKREVRAVTLAQLAPLPGQLLWDVGAGAGSIAIEWLRVDPRCRAIAIERDPARADRITRNASALGVPSLRVVIGPAPGVLAELDRPDTIFVGGGVSAPGMMSTCWASLPPGGRLVANAVTVAAEATLASWHAEHGGSLTRIQLHRAAPLGTAVGWRPSVPVTQWAARKT